MEFKIIIQRCVLRRHLHSIAKDCSRDLLNIIINKDNIWIKNSSGYTPIDLACKYHTIRHFEDLIDAHSRGKFVGLDCSL